MEPIATTNWLTVVGLLYLGVAFVLLAKPLVTPVADRAQKAMAHRAAIQRADTLLALPFLAVGIVTLIAAQFYVAHMSATVVLLAISLCLALVLYVGLDGVFVEEGGEAAVRREIPRQLPAAANVEQERPALQIVQSS